MRSEDDTCDLRVSIIVPQTGDVVVRAPGVARAGLLGPLTLAVCMACLPEGEYEIVVCDGEPSMTATPRESLRIEEACAMLAAVRNEALALAIA